MDETKQLKFNDNDENYAHLFKERYKIDRTIILKLVTKIDSFCSMMMKKSINNKKSTLISTFFFLSLSFLVVLALNL